MKFINRKKELAKLEEYYGLSKRRIITVAISGLRRVGKTTLVKKFIKNKKAIYFFVYGSKTSLDLLNEFSEELRKHKIITEIEAITSWHLFFEIIFKRCKNYVVVFDEFQNFNTIEPSVFSIMQKNCDDYKTNPINIIILGSLIGLFKKIFEDKKQPLYGRISAKLNLNPFSLKNSIKTLHILKYEHFESMLKIYGIFGGFPKYYASIEQFALEKKDYLAIIKYLFIQENAPLETEVANILSQEFGRRSSLFYSILYSISIGKVKLSEIAANIHMKESSITRHLLELENKFNLIKSIRPIDNKKNTRYFIKHPLILFWFTFVYDKFSKYSLKDVSQLMYDIKNKYNAFFGYRFEEICQEFIAYLNVKNQLPLKLEFLSNWWGHKRENDKRKEIEIDLIGFSKKSNKIIFIECKWKDNVDAEKILKQLKEKSLYVHWMTNRRKEFFCIIAKSFKKRIKHDDLLLFDLKDIDKGLSY